MLPVPPLGAVERNPERIQALVTGWGRSTRGKEIQGMSQERASYCVKTRNAPNFPLCYTDGKQTTWF